MTRMLPCTDQPRKTRRTVDNWRAMAPMIEEINSGWPWRGDQCFGIQCFGSGAYGLRPARRTPLARLICWGTDMSNQIRRFLATTELAGAAALASAVLCLPVSAEPIDRPRFEAVLVAARGYAEERSFIFYCMRQDAEARTFLYYVMYEDITDTLKKLRAAGSDLRQSAELVEAVLATVQVAQPDAKDSALDARCGATSVMQEINLLQGIGSPLFMRPVVRALNPP
jgi:hypothetical protein